MFHDATTYRFEILLPQHADFLLSNWDNTAVMFNSEMKTVFKMFKIHLLFKVNGAQICAHTFSITYRLKTPRRAHFKAHFKTHNRHNK